MSPHPAVVLLALLLDPLRELGLSEAAAWLVQPATVHGRRGLDELMEQTRALLAFADDKPTDVFGQQLAFNVLPDRGQDPAALASQIAAAAGRRLDAGDRDRPGQRLPQLHRQRFGRVRRRPRRRGDSRPLWAPIPCSSHTTPTAGRGRDRSRPPAAARCCSGRITPAAGPPGRYWLRAVMDNLTRGGAINALEIAAAVLG